MSLFTLLSTAVAVPLALVVVVFFWFLLRAQVAGLRRKWAARKKARYDARLQRTTVSPFSNTFLTSVSMPVMTPNYIPAPAHRTPPEYQPLSYFLGDTVTSTASNVQTLQFELKDIPGINDTLQNELYDLGYTSVEQIARWGRADVRAVSALLGIEQHEIEEEWIEGARLILSIR